MQRNHQQAFTLVEIAIVLVIIGLLIGGVMVGKDLITGGEINKQAAQIAQYKTAINTFRDKYNGLPGDLVPATANGFHMITRNGTAGHGDGNGRVEGCAANATNAGCETLLFWTDLSFAGLISPIIAGGTDAPVEMASLSTPELTAAQQFAMLQKNFSFISEAHALPFESGDPDCTCNFMDPDTGMMSSEPCLPDGSCAAHGTASSNKEDYLPPAVIGDNSVTVYTDGTSNYFQLTSVVSTSATGVYTLQNSIKPLDAASIDTKLDDGIPLTGSVRAMGGTGPLGVLAVPGANNCVSNAAGNAYNTTTDALASAPLCQLSLRAQ